MDEYLRYLMSSWGKIEIADKVFCQCFILKSEKEVIMKEAWHDEEHQEMKCPLHKGLLSKENIQRSEDKLESRDIQSLPKCVHLKRSGTVGNEYGVWSNMKISKGIRFGPYEGITLNEDEAGQSTDSWKILEDKDIGCFVDAKSENESNWLRYVNFTSHQEQQNLIVLHHNGQIYYETIRDIDPDTELLVWCRNECAPLPETERKDIVEECNSSIINTPVSYAFWSSGPIKKYDASYKNQNRKKIHECHYCKKTFKCVSDLNRHIRVHTGEKPFACDLCGRRFTQSHNLSEHKRIHKKDKAYVCHICKKSFKQSRVLFRHLEIHMKLQF